MIPFLVFLFFLNLIIVLTNVRSLEASERYQLSLWFMLFNLGFFSVQCSEEATEHYKGETKRIDEDEGLIERGLKPEAGTIIGQFCQDMGYFLLCLHV